MAYNRSESVEISWIVWLMGTKLLLSSIIVLDYSFCIKKSAGTPGTDPADWNNRVRKSDLIPNEDKMIIQIGQMKYEQNSFFV